MSVDLARQLPRLDQQRSLLAALHVCDPVSLLILGVEGQSPVIETTDIRIRPRFRSQLCYD